MPPFATPLRPRRTVEIVRPDWYSQRPDYCQAAIDSHLNCLRNAQLQRGSSIDFGTPISSIERNPAGACYASHKLYDYCAKEDFDGFVRDQSLRNARAAGAIIPEYVNYGKAATVYYGKVTDDFQPTMPPKDVILAKLDEDSSTHVEFVMERTASGTLRKISVTEFLIGQVVPGTKCYGTDRPASGIAARECDDIVGLNGLINPRMLGCYYNDDQGKYWETMYWYGDRPGPPETDPMSPENLMRRSKSHPLLWIGEPRTACPKTFEQASRMHADIRSRLERQNIRQIPANVVLPGPWEKEMKQRQAEYEARNRILAEQNAVMADFPLEGVYRLERTVDGKTSFNTCTMIRMNAWNITIDCPTGNGDRFWGKGRHQKGSHKSFTFNLHNGHDTTDVQGVFNGKYQVDLDSRKKGNDVLVPASVGNRGVLPENSRLVRAGDLIERFSDMPIEGDYDLILNAGEASLSAQCTFQRNNSYRPNRFDMTCTTKDGVRIENSTAIPLTAESALVRFNYWPGNIKLNDERISNLRAIIDPAYKNGGAGKFDLIVYADYGISGRFVRK